MPKIFKEIHIIDFKKDLLELPARRNEENLFFPFGKVLPVIENQNPKFYFYCNIKFNRDTELHFLCLSLSTCKLLPIKSI
uniref:Uncharacterized protein n=1 Tax=Sciurus vulgaris TaxID=55149 RepID=A0A8D2B0V2_SCIVU